VAAIAREAGFAVQVEDTTLLGPHTRPDVTCSDPHTGAHYAVDVAVVDPQAPSYLPASASTPLSAAHHTEQLKDRRYSEALRTHRHVTLFPVVVETLGAVGSRGCRFLRLCAARRTRQLQDAGAGDAAPSPIADDNPFLLSYAQRLSLALQRAQTRVLFRHAASSVPSASADLEDGEIPGSACCLEDVDTRFEAGVEALFPDLVYVGRPEAFTSTGE
jgi:hypothetical protein